MTRALLILNDQETRTKAARWAMTAPGGTRIEFKRPQRSLDQNSRMWAMLTEVSEQVEYFGKKRTPDVWKDLFSAAYRQVEMLPGLDGQSFVQVGLRSSDLSKEEMSGLMELIAAYGAEHGVTFKEAA